MDSTETATPSLVLFGRLPVPGQVKTRLAAGVGPDKACAFYKRCCEHVLAQTAECEGVRRTFFFSNEGERTPVAEWMASISQDVELASQLQVLDLGERMHAALTAVLQQGASKAVIVGTDVPDLSASILHTALRALDDHDVVVGPAADGGYYLLGMKAAHAALFENVAWSTGKVLTATLANAARAALRVAPVGTLPTLRDIDTVADLQEWLQGATLDHALRTPVGGLLEVAAER